MNRQEGEKSMNLLKRTVLILLLGAVFLVPGCAEEPVPAAEPGAAPDPVAGDLETVAAEATEEMLDIVSEMPAPAPGQWIAFRSDQAEGELSLAVVRSEDYQGVPCLWYQMSIDEMVFQVLVDQSYFDAIRDDMRGYITEIGHDPAAWFAANLADGDPSNLLMPEGDPSKIVDFVRAIKTLKIEADGQIIMVTLDGIPEMLETLIADNPDFLGEAGADIAIEEDLDFAEFMAAVQEAQFVLEHTTLSVAGTDLDCVVLSVAHQGTGRLEIAMSAGLPILPLAHASVVPDDPDEQGGKIYVSGFGFEGAEDLLPGAPDMTFPAAMMIQGFL